MDDVSIDHAKEHLEELLARARRGEDVRIAMPDGETVRLHVVITDRENNEPIRPKLQRGRWKGRFVVPARLFEPLSEDEMAWLSGASSK